MNTISYTDLDDECLILESIALGSLNRERISIRGLTLLSLDRKRCHRRGAMRRLTVAVLSITKYTCMGIVLHLNRD